MASKKTPKVTPDKLRFAYLKERESQRDLLGSVLEGLYDEVDKLTKKGPANEVTELTLRHVNRVIKQAKDILQGDPYIDTIDEFVAAGENPEYRDVLLVLRDIRQGLERQEREYHTLEYKVPMSWR